MVREWQNFRVLTEYASNVEGRYSTNPQVRSCSCTLNLSTKNLVFRRYTVDAYTYTRPSRATSIITANHDLQLLQLSREWDHHGRPLCSRLSFRCDIGIRVPKKLRNKRITLSAHVIASVPGICISFLMRSRLEVIGDLTLFSLEFQWKRGNGSVVVDLLILLNKDSVVCWATGVNPACYLTLAFNTQFIGLAWLTAPSGHLDWRWSSSQPHHWTILVHSKVALWSWLEYIRSVVPRTCLSYDCFWNCCQVDASLKLSRLKSHPMMSLPTLTLSLWLQDRSSIGRVGTLQTTEYQTRRQAPEYLK